MLVYIKIELSCILFSYLQDFNMVKRKSRLRTYTAIIVGAETELVCGSESYGGKKILWREKPAWVWLSVSSQYKYGGVVEKTKLYSVSFSSQRWDSVMRELLQGYNNWIGFNILQVRVLSPPQFNLFPKVSMGVKECVILSILFYWILYRK